MLEVTFHDDFDHIIIICIANIFLFIDGGDGQIRFLLVWIWAGATNVAARFDITCNGSLRLRHGWSGGLPSFSWAQVATDEPRRRRHRSHGVSSLHCLHTIQTIGDDPGRDGTGQFEGEPEALNHFVGKLLKFPSRWRGLDSMPALRNVHAHFAIVVLLVC